MAVSERVWCLLVIAFNAGLVRAQDVTCYGPGSIATSVILTFILTLVVLYAGWYWWKKYKTKKEHIILENDPEKGKGEFAFDNPGFKDATLPISKTAEKDKLDGSKLSIWNQWSPLSVLSTKSEKKKTRDDTAIDGYEVKVTALRSHDFTGLGFNICGNMKEGIFIKDILHRGPAFESGKLNPGDRIYSITISFEHMVYEDALTILSYASPYDVIVEARSGKLMHSAPGQGEHPAHPVYKSSSCTDLYNVKKSSKRKLLGEDPNGSMSSNYSSLQKSKSNMTTLERKESKSPIPGHVPPKIKSKHPAAEQLNLKLPEHQLQKTEAEKQKTEPKYQKFGIKVLPLEQQKSPKSAEQNENNINIEKHWEVVPAMGIDEVDKTPKPAPPIKKRERKAEETTAKPEPFQRSHLNGSGIKRDDAGIPQEVPDHMWNAAVAARNNRKSTVEETTDGDEMKTPKRKGKAPSPPEENKSDLDKIYSITDEDLKPSSASPDETEQEVHTTKGKNKDYNSDSDVETDNQSSVNTIELNSSDITIHQTEEDRQNRKTVSTGDLTKIEKTRKSSSGTLERAQSLDISDPGMPNNLKDDLMKSDEDLFRKVMSDKEPRLSLILDGLNTFQRNRLKKSTEWGNLEDAISKLNQDDDSIISIDDKVSIDRISLSETSPEFDALVNKINQIKRESLELETPVITDVEEKTEKEVNNEIWPNFENETEDSTDTNNHVDVSSKPDSLEPELPLAYERRQHIPPIAEKPIGLPKKIIHNNINEPFERKKLSVEDVDETERSPEFDRVKIRQRVPENINTIPPPEAEEGITPNDDILIQEQWNISDVEHITNTSPPSSLEIFPEPDEDLRKSVPTKSSKTMIRPEEVLSKIPLLNSMVKSQQEAMKKPILSANSTDETKTVVTYNTRPIQPNLQEVTQNFLYTEQLNCVPETYVYSSKSYDTNVSDDIKVSRHSYGSLELQSPQSDDSKSEDSLRHISSVSVTNGDSELHSLELSINEPSELYTTALNTTSKESKNDSKVTISTPDLIKNVTLAEAISTLNNDISYKTPLVTVEVPKEPFCTKASSDPETDFSAQNSTLTYVTEIKVTPNNGTRTTTRTNISEVEIVSDEPKPNGQNLDTDFENYLKSFESKLENFENNIQEFDKNLEEFIKEEPTSIVLNEKIDEKGVSKIQEIAEAQLKKLPEMKFTTSSYESQKIPEKRQSQIELLRSNFERASPKPKAEIIKSRIPIATTAKTPPMSPERRDSRNLDVENDKALLELMSSPVTSTPYSTSKYQIKPPNKNVTVTSIRNNSKIPSGLPMLSNRPPIAPRKTEVGDSSPVAVSANDNVESSFKQWVFNPSNTMKVSLSEDKQQKL